MAQQVDSATDLLCYENVTKELDQKCDSIYDKVLLKDDRVLNLMLDAEDKYMPSPSYLSCVQTEMTPTTRETLAVWMFEVRFLDLFMFSIN